MTDPTALHREAALQALADMLARSEKAQAAFAPGTSQHTLQANRIFALQVARALLTQESHAYTSADFERAKAPIASLLSKSEKALGKLQANRWQYQRLETNISALTLALGLLAAK